MQSCNRIYYSKMYWRLNTFWAPYGLSSGAPNCICSLWFIYPRVVTGCCPGWVGNGSGISTVSIDWISTNSGDTWSSSHPTWTTAGHHTWVYKPEASNTVWSSWWWAVCRSKRVEPSINFGIINSITRLNVVGHFYWYITTSLSLICVSWITVLHCEWVDSY
jgi:hypothetical protein